MTAPTPPRPPGEQGPSNVPQRPGIGARQDASPSMPASSSVAPARPEKKKRNVSVGQILGGILFVITIIFVLENTRSVKVRLIGPEVTTPLAVPIIIAAVLGALIAWLLRYRRQLHAKNKETRERRR